ncbi:putative manganese-dependent inorganic diphosphatase [Helcococcus kunzii]|uniref:putative manganese-dependent inorganic diphosphatase n=1 Tax=Helcococcus kunzii TaxID=40091 RepID=UPI0021A3A70D|nr:putative manganese-dependent inorganic diphosphatase [Helcococcus kunzii]MCT1795395.1 putative manganese-dependent inorganic diphosphatase [Helcococcus kunzii]MCT1989654.1 putative manganese-dependent inorganic diphosphatase [Helcococcus kunzii]
MKNKIYITGHKNPDTDSIASAIVYSDLKSRIDSDNEYVPIRLGDLNLESKWVLEKWNQDAPKYVENLKQKVEDLGLVKPLTIKDNISIYQAANYLQPRNISFLPIVDDEGRLKGIVTLSNLTKSYMDVWDDVILWRAGTKIENIVEVLSGEIVHLPENPNKFDGRMLVYASQVDEEGHSKEGDILIVGNRLDSQREAIERKVGILIVSSGHKVEDDILQKAKENNVTVLTTKYNSFMAARLLPQAIPVSYVMTTDNLQYFKPEEYLEDVSRKVKNTRFRNFPIVNDDLVVIGELNRNDLLFDKKKQLILVDHNESNQSIDDRDNVEILEIIDHHRVANIHTNSPIYFRNVPVGCTSTILAMMYKEYGLTPSKEMAGLMASAIISDTLLFRSPTTTEVDKKILRELAEIAEIDLEAYGEEMFSAGTSLEGVSVTDILMTDSKKFEIEDKNARVSQAFTTNLDSVEKFIDEIITSMTNVNNNEKTDVFALFITDIFNEQSLVITVGKLNEVIANEFGVEYKEKGYLVKDLLSRKKQFIPALTRAVSKIKEEE